MIADDIWFTCKNCGYPFTPRGVEREQINYAHGYVYIDNEIQTCPECDSKDLCSNTHYCSVAGCKTARLLGLITKENKVIVDAMVNEDAPANWFTKDEVEFLLREGYGNGWMKAEYVQQSPRVKFGFMLMHTPYSFPKLNTGTTERWCQSASKN